MTMSINFKGICDQFDRMNFPAAHENRHPDLETIKQARQNIEQAIVSKTFLLDCIELELELIENNNLGSGLIPFFVHQKTGIQFSFGYWSPGSSPGPHVHTAWTLTAVCRNELNVVTYETDAAVEDGELIPVKDIDAKEGQVGFIQSVCVHNPTNKSKNWSWTLHVTSPLDGQDTEEFASDRFRFEPGSSNNIEHPFSEVARNRQRMVRLRYLSVILASLEGGNAEKCKAKCAALGTRSISRKLYRDKIVDIEGSKLPYHLELAHRDIKLNCQCADGAVSLLVDTPTGPIPLVEMDKIAEPALRYAAKHHTFNVHTLPGEISSEEQQQIGETLENIGLFRSLI